MMNGVRSSGIFFVFFLKWLCLVCQGDYICVFYCNSNSGNWILFYQVYVLMGNCVEMGLVVFIIDFNGDVMVVFSSVNYQSQGGQSLFVFNGLVWEVEMFEEVKVSVVLNLVWGQFILQFSKLLFIVGQVMLFNEFGQ